MNDLTILHLSDLHISWDARTTAIPTLHRNLLNDIKAQEEFLSSPIIVVVTGDIINQGDYSQSTKNAVLEFFTKLHKILGEKAKHIIIVPGNHEKEKIDVQSAFSKLYYGQSAPMEDAFEELLDLNNQYYKNYIDLANAIYKIFEADEEIDRTYGVKTICVSPSTPSGYSDEGSTPPAGKANVCFICLNSTLACSKGKDYRHLRLGERQINKICKEHKEKVQSLPTAPVLTFVVSHHPLSWLVGEEENTVQDLILSPTNWNANIFLCGHVHQRDAIGMRNNHHSLTTLTTGFGWPDSGKPQTERHTYSYYVFNLDYNSIDIYVRSTSDGGNFMPDFTFYGDGFKSEYPTKVVYPIDSNKTQAYYEIGTSNGRSGKAFYFSDQFVKQLESYGPKMCVFQSHITTFISKQEDNFLFNLLIDKIFQNTPQNHHDKKSGQFQVSSKALKDCLKNISGYSELWENHIQDPASIDLYKIQGIINDNIEFVNTIFDSFIQAICSHVINDLCSIDQPNGNKTDPTDLRFHARSYTIEYVTNQKQDGDAKVEIVEKYKHFCVAPYSMPSDYLPKDIPWKGSLIQAAFESNRSLIFQNNIENSVLPNNHWNNFITIIPKFSQNIIQTNQGRRPLITFGLSIAKEEYNYMLYLLEFFKIENVLGNIFESFLRSFPIDLESYFKANNGEITKINP